MLKEKIQPLPQKVVLLHGLFMHGILLFPLLRVLKQKGYECIALSYPSVRRNCHENAISIAEKIRSFACNEPVYFVGHSLGGLLLHHLQSIHPELFIDSRVVTLGTPHLGSEVARYFYDHSLLKWVLGQSWQGGLDGNVPTWHQEIPLLSIAGVCPIGIGRFFGILKKTQLSDGIVTIEETRLLEASAYREINTTHTLLPYIRQSTEYICDWFAL